MRSRRPEYKDLRMRADVPPMMIGPHGRAWQYDLAHVRKLRGVGPDDDATIASWVIEAPWANMMWHSYNLFVLHLRQMPDKRPLIIHLPGATHELGLFALDPEWRLDLTQNPRWLHPGNFAAQFVAGSDESAAQHIMDCVTDIVGGRLNPDTDATQSWIQRFNASMIKGDPKDVGATKLQFGTPGNVREIVVDPQAPGQKPDTRPWSVKLKEPNPAVALMLRSMGLDPSKIL